VNWNKPDVDGGRWRSRVVTGLNHRISKEGITLLAARTVVCAQNLSLMRFNIYLVYPEARAPGCLRYSLIYLKGKV
jgi:hypothetical protein